MAKAFVSFLGTNNYMECKYDLDDDPGDVVKYVQEDLVRRCCREWGPEDAIRIFTTAEAEKRNWRDNGHRDWTTKDIIESQGLGNRLRTIDTRASVRRFDIPMGNSEDEIWEIFQRVYDTLKEDEEIIFDITHGFRSIPMLFMVLIGYARLLKNISVAGIYYGAFEVLGRQDQAAAISLDRRIAPIFDLTSFEQIIEWTEATQSFVKNGSAEEFERLTNRRINPVLKDSRGRDRAASAMRDIVKGMKETGLNILVNRGADILGYNYEKIKSALHSLKDDEIFIKPLIPLVSEIEDKVDVFARNDIANGFRAVDWCVSHGLVQQAITMLFENLITHILAEAGEEWGVKSNRDAVSASIKIASEKRADWENNKDEAEILFIKKMLKLPLVMELVPQFEKLREIRNDVNHGGFITESGNHCRSARSILDKFQSCYDEICEFLKI